MSAEKGSWHEGSIAGGAARNVFLCRRRERGDGLVEAKVELCPSERQFLAIGGMMKPVVTNLDEALRQNVLEEAMEEVKGRQSHLA